MNVQFQRWIASAASVSIHGGALCQGPGDEPKVALTFDDGPHPRWTSLLLDELERQGLTATFFVVGRCVAEHPSIVREARRRGHEIGTHLYWHRRTSGVHRQALLDEIARSRDELEQVLGERISFLRFPYGERGGLSSRVIQRNFGLRSVHWTFSSLDSRARQPSEIVKRVSSWVRPGAVVLMHDCLADEHESLPERYNPDRTAVLACIPALRNLLDQAGLEAVTLSQLIPPACNAAR